MLKKKSNMLERDVWCLLGLPLDNFRMSDVVNKIYQSIENNTSCVISTPNVDFIVTARTDWEFRKTIINSDISIADGKPLIWLARILNIPINEKISGSTLFEYLQRNTEINEMRVFFFGGEKGVAEKACHNINQSSSKLTCVGSYNPGFGTIEDISKKNILDQINDVKPDFIVTSVGAKKGQKWGQVNNEILSAPVISHLGAVVNFVAGKIKRSPKFIENIGFEWLWRIKEEPKLFKRYFYDGLILMQLITSKVIPLSIINYIFKNKHNPGLIADIKEQNTVIKLKFSGFLSSINSDIFTKKYIEIKSKSKDVDIIIDKGSYMDSMFLAKTMILNEMLINENCRLRIITDSKLIKNIFKYNCCEYLLC